jgi:hypothetical protein
MVERSQAPTSKGSFLAPLRTHSRGHEETAELSLQSRRSGVRKPQRRLRSAPNVSRHRARPSVEEVNTLVAPRRPYVAGAIAGVDAEAPDCRAASVQYPAVNSGEKLAYAESAVSS